MKHIAYIGHIDYLKSIFYVFYVPYVGYVFHKIVAVKYGYYFPSLDNLLYCMLF